KGRFGDWLENVQDWGISRNRYWGTPLNIWECACGLQHAIGSREELRQMSDNCPENVELHRPFIDEVTLRCPECGGVMKRVPEVIDCWFDSGAMPFAQHHYPFENADLFEQQFPADFISEAVDQTRGWFYSLMAISTLLFNKAPFKNVIVLGHVQDENGQKMSKSKGNAVDPMEALQTYGADAIRWYFYSNSAPWLPNRFHGKAVQECQRKFLSTLWNTYAFFVLYANIDGFDSTKYTLEYDKLSVMDKWVLSRLNSTVRAADEHLANYRIPETARVLEDFVDELSNWYVRRSRERFWAKGMEQDKINAYMTLHTALVTIAKASAPLIPFMAEDIYRNLVCSDDASAPMSVHLCDYPTVNDAYIDTALESTMDAVVQIVVLGRAARNGASCKNRQPLGKMFVQMDGSLDEAGVAIIAEELNIKSVEKVADASAFMSYSFKPQLKTVGPKYGKQLGEIRTALAELDGNAAKAQLDAAGALSLALPSGTVTLYTEDLLIDTVQTEGYYTVADRGITVALDTTLTEELIEEGFVREVVSKLQTMRKEAGFEVMDTITVYVSGNDKVQAVMETNKASLLQDVMGTALVSGTTAGYVKEWDINGESVTLAVQKN
ncbi:MAG: isoleucine--tRNA ligase, partial [Ruminococcaceae bacterium]|nr:isoleucine--tRNA ligase [Oscillospiraceae bacterium]